MSSDVVLTSLPDASQIAVTNSVTQRETTIALLEYADTKTEFYTSIPIHSGQEFRIGRDDEKCDYAIHDFLVSKQHFRIYSISYEDDETASCPPALIYCEDLESTNGTYVNGALVGITRSERVGYLLSHGDVIEIRPYWKFTLLQPTLSNLREYRDGNQLHELRSFDSLYTVANRPLGTGQSCIVYLASEVGSTKQLACKVIDLRVPKQSFGRREPWEDRAKQVKERKIRAQREIRLLSELNHPNIISLRKAFISKETIYMFLELAAGGDLFSYIQANGNWLEDYHSRIITRQVAIAIQFIHSEGIAHRDIKPENVLITRRDIGLRVVLTDFGHARRSDTTRIFRKGSDVGTCGYAAPELINQTDAGYTDSADMYSLGVVTLLTLTGTHVIPPMIELPEMSDTEIEEHFPDDQKAQHSQMRWQELFPSAQSYLRGLLHVEPEKRMNASEALAHIWYTHPRGHPDEVENVYQRSIKFWMPRDKEEKVDEYFPGCGPAPEEITKKPRDRLPDASASPYFNLDRHTQHRGPSKRKRILAALRESGSQFLVPDTQSTTGNRKPKAIANMSLQRYLPAIRSVPVNDIFGTNLTDVRSPSNSSLDGLALGSNIVVPPMEGESVTQDGSQTIPEECSSVERQPGEQVNKRYRKESWDPEDKILHEVAAKKLPLFCTAKVYKEAVAKERKAGLKSK